VPIFIASSTTQETPEFFQPRPFARRTRPRNDPDSAVDLSRRRAHLHSIGERRTRQHQCPRAGGSRSLQQVWISGDPRRSPLADSQPSAAVLRARAAPSAPASMVMMERSCTSRMIAANYPLLTCKRYSAPPHCPNRFEVIRFRKSRTK
jgi:hypothetical protein